MYCISGWLSGWFGGFKEFLIQPCGYIDTTYVSRIKRIGKKMLKTINCKARVIKRLQRARESHRKQSEVEESEQDL